MSVRTNFSFSLCYGMLEPLYFIFILFLFLFYFLDNEESLCHISRILWKRLERMILRYMSIAYSSHSILMDDT